MVSDRLFKNNGTAANGLFRRKSAACEISAIEILFIV